MIEIDLKDGIAVLKMRYGKANALDIEFCNTLAARLSELRDEEKVKALVLTGQGSMFSAGVDLRRLTEGGADYIREFLPALHRLYAACFHHPKPVVAAINGHAIAGGCVLACCADRRLMGRDAGRVGVTELLVGVPFPALAFEIVRFAVPARNLAELMLGATTCTSDAALRAGWVDTLVDPATLMEEALVVAQNLAALSPAAFAQTKAQIRQPVTERVAATGAATDAVVTDIWCAPETLRVIGNTWRRR